MGQTLYWLAPVGVVAVVTGGAAVTAAASSTPDLEPRTVEQIIAAVVGADVDAVSGTLCTDTDLGLPELPDSVASAMGSAVGAAPTDADASATQTADSDAALPFAVLSRFFTGENEVDLWIDGPGERIRVDLDDSQAAARFVAGDGTLAAWTQADGTVTTWTLPSEAAAEPETGSGITIPTPDDLAREVLDAADPTTELRVADPTIVAGHSAYVLVADPADDATLVDRIELAVDSETGLPLRVAVYAVDQRSPAFETGWVDIEFGSPDESVFTDAFPADAATVDAGVLDHTDLPWGQDAALDEEATGPETLQDEAAGVETTGSGWSTVVTFGSAASTDADPAAGIGMLGGLLEPVDGGAARQTALFSVLLTDDGRLLTGSVPVDVLVATANS